MVVNSVPDSSSQEVGGNGEHTQNSLARPQPEASRDVHAERALDPERESPPKLLPNPLTVLQLTPRLDAGGVERGTIEIAKAIVEAGGRALVATAGGGLERRLINVGGEVIRLDMSSKSPFAIRRNARALRRLIAREGINVVHARSRAPAWSGYLASRRTKTPFITTWHGVYGEGGWFKRRYNNIMSRGRPVIAVSNFIRDLIITRYRGDVRNIEVIPRGADLQIFSEDAVGEERIIEALNLFGILDDPRPIVMLVSRLTRWKGIENLIDAAKILKSRIGADRFNILILGDDSSGGSYAKELGRRITKHRVTDCVSLTGGVADVPAACKLATVVVSTSIEPEAFGRVVVEAQAMGRPVIATNHGGACETVIDGKTGMLYPPGNVNALVETLERVLSMSPSERAQMGEAARVHAQQNYAISKMQNATLRIYEQVAGRRFNPAL